MPKETVLRTEKISKHFITEGGIFNKGRSRVDALREVSFFVEEFQTLGIVGESGSGKTTLAKIILGLIEPDSGMVIFNKKRIVNLRKDVQIIFQNPYASLDPKMRIIDILTEAMIIHNISPKSAFRDKAIELLKMVDLREDILYRYPIQFSGGQRQRICIARALASNPKFIVLDEPISSLDLTVQLRILELFIELKDKLNLTYVFITHNLAVIKNIADRVLVMNNGRVIEEGATEEIFTSPRDAYTIQLLDAARK